MTDLILPTTVGGEDGTGHMHPLKVDQNGMLLTTSSGPVGIQAVSQSGDWAVGQIGLWSMTLAGALPAGGNAIGAVSQDGAWSFELDGALPSGGNTIGGVTQAGTWNVGQASAWNVGQSGSWVVGQSGAWTVSLSASLPAGTNAIGSVAQLGTWTVQQSAPWAVTQSGAWAVSVPSPVTVQGGNTAAVYVREPSIRSVGALGLAGSAGVIVTATVAGGVLLTFADGSTMPAYVPVGTTIWRLVPTAVTASALGTILAAALSAVKSFSES